MRKKGKTKKLELSAFVTSFKQGYLRFAKKRQDQKTWTFSIRYFV